MKLNWAERWVVNNPSRILQQRLEVRWLRRAAPLPQGARILEIGCGRGAGAALIQEAFRPSVLHAMDLDMEMIRRAGAFLPSAKRTRIEMYAADALHLPYRDGALDAVFGFGVLHHVPDWQGALREIARVLRDGGTYYVEELYPHLYQNFLTKHILLHPKENRFFSRHLRQALGEARFAMTGMLEWRLVGILGAFRKNGSPAPA